MRLFHDAIRTLRYARAASWALLDRRHVLLAQVIVTRRCNLKCAYCNEYDEVSDPVPLDQLRARLAKLDELGVAIVTLSGGEPLLHPELPTFIAEIRRRGIIAGMITNGFLLSPQLIEALNRAGLDEMQISVDSVEPTAASVKSLRSLDAKLVHLARHASFEVNVNTVLGTGAVTAADLETITRRVEELGFSLTVGLIHDQHGQFAKFSAEERRAYDAFTENARGIYPHVHEFQDRLVRGELNDWHCRAGSRYLYVCERGLVHYCSQTRGQPAKPLADYDARDLRTEFDRPKLCASRCTIGCVHRVAVFDNWRRQEGEVPFGTREQV